jgi:hypothetical protein
MTSDTQKQPIVQSLSDDDNIDNYHFQIGSNWEPENVTTLLQWVHTCAIFLDVMVESARYYRTIIRRNTILSLIFSTLGSTVSLSQFSINQDTQPILSLATKIFFTVTSAIIAISTGYMKIYQVHEKLEKVIKLQQEWTTFGSQITSELQLPVHLRKDALYLIIKYKHIYTDLFKQQVDVSYKILRKVAIKNGVKADDLTLSELFERVIESEAKRINMMTKDTVADNKQMNLLRMFSFIKPLIKPIMKPIIDPMQPPKVNEQRRKVTTMIMSPKFVTDTQEKSKRDSIITSTTYSSLPEPQNELIISVPPQPSPPQDHE